MNAVHWIMGIVLVLILGKWLFESFLTALNLGEVRRHEKEIPEPLQDVMDEPTYRKSIDYTRAKSRFGLVHDSFGVLVLLLVLFSGLLPFLYQLVGGGDSTSIWRESLFLVVVMLLLSLPDIPFDYYSQFRLEERFGFNKSTLGLWVSDKIKGTILGLIIGVPLITLLLFLVTWAGSWWWLWAFAVFFIVQILMMILYPMLILPWFNKLTPLPEGDLRDRLMSLSDRTGFQAKTIQVMDGSKRSGHSNAFFTGFGRFRRIVLFDTLIEQLQPDELESVLAHEIGHYKMGHIPKTLALSAGMLLLSFYLLAVLVAYPPFIEAFGFDFSSSGVGPAFLLFALLAGLVTFWLTPLFNILSRKHEYEADAFARDHASGVEPMAGALRKLSEKNLSNLTPHQVFSGFYYSHPTLLERLKSLGA